MPQTPSSHKARQSALIYSHVALGKVESTNDEAIKLAEAGAPAGTIVTATMQSAGKARVGRKWNSPLGNLYVSLVLRPTRPANELGSLSLLAALAIGHTVGNLISYVDSWQVKWPNDVLIDGAKISGVLAESQVDEKGRVAWVVLGMGVNVEVAPALADRPSTSLKKQGLDTTVDTVFFRLQEQFRILYEIWEQEGFEGVKLDWISHAHGFGCAAYVRLNNEVITGNFADIDDDGAIIIEETTGTRRRILAGDVVMAH